MSHVSASSCVHKLDRLDMGADTAFWPWVEIICFRHGDTISCTALAIIVLTEHPCLHQGKGYCSSLLEQMCCWLHKFDFRHRGSVGFVPLGCLHSRHPRQCLLELHLAGCVQCKAERPTVHNPGMS